MPIVKSAANRIDWAKIISNLKITGPTVQQLSSFKKRNDEARHNLLELQNANEPIDFNYYRSKLKNQKIVDDIEKMYKSYKPVVINSKEQIDIISSFEKHAMENAKDTEKLISKELDALQSTLANIENARPFDQLTVDDIVKANPEIEKKVEKMIKNGKWDVPGYEEKFGSLNVM